MQTPPFSTLPRKYHLMVLCLTFWSFFLLGTFFPDYWWGSHYMAFLPKTLQSIFILLGSYFLLHPLFSQQGLGLASLQSLTSPKAKYLVPIGLSLIFVILAMVFPIEKDFFGDAYKMADFLDKKVSTIPSGTNEAFFRFKLSPWEGRNSILAVITYIAYFAHVTYGQAFILLDIVCGGLFILIWSSFAYSYFENWNCRIMMVLAGITAPFSLVFYGHMECYAPILLFFMFWQIICIKYFQKPSRTKLWLLSGLLLISLKLHTIALLFVPTLLILFMDHYFPGSTNQQALSSWKGITRYLLLPIFVAGAFLYFYVFQDHLDSRDFNQSVQEFDHLFLPLFSPEAPLDNYNLLSWNHIFDYFSEVLIWSPIALFALIFAILFYRSEINWESREIQLTGLNLILFASLFFMINPLLSMQMDWDLMALPAPVFLIFCAILLKQFEESPIIDKLVAPCFGLAIFSLTTFLVHSDARSLSQRYQSLGIRAYHTYYQRSAKIIHYGLDMLPYKSQAHYEERNKQLIEKLEPYAQKDIDFEYARLLSRQGKYFLRIEKDYEKAIHYLKKGTAYFPTEKNLVLYLMETHFLRGEYEAALGYSMELIRQRYPSEKKSLTIGLQCALEAEVYDEAQAIAAYYVSHWNDNEVVQQIHQTFESSASPENLKLLFQR